MSTESRETNIPLLNQLTLLSSTPDTDKHTPVKPVTETMAHEVSPTTSRDVYEAATTASANEKSAVDIASVPTIAADGATITPTPTSDDLLSESSRQVDPGEACFFGLSHIMIPVSTIELFFRRFDMLERQLDELKSLMTKSPDSPSVSSILSSGGAAVDVANLTARVSALEGGLANHSSVLEETTTNTRLLLDATEGLKDDLRKVHGEIECPWCLPRLRF